MAFVYSLNSDNEFIRAGYKAKDKSVILQVYKYKTGGGSVPNDLEMPMNGAVYTFELWESIGTGFYEELKVHGVTFSKEWVSSLANDLIVTGKDGQKFHLMVNRQGLCLLDVSGDSGPVKWLRINDRFGWSKYGVKMLQGGNVNWSVCDMHNGAVLVNGREE
ncbi:hypothetical protein LINPERHAP2_LOCUS32028 [Linum perenne]